MSNYHVRMIRDDGREASVIFHIPIPNENNSAPISLRTAVSQFIKPRNDDGTYGVFKSQIEALGAEETQLQNGELYEHVEVVKFLAADNNAQKQTKIDNRYTALTTGILNRIRANLKFWGFDRNVP